LFDYPQFVAFFFWVKAGKVSLFFWHSHQGIQNTFLKHKKHSNLFVEKIMQTSALLLSQIPYLRPLCD